VRGSPAFAALVAAGVIVATAVACTSSTTEGAGTAPSRTLTGASSAPSSSTAPSKAVPSSTASPVISGSPATSASSSSSTPTHPVPAEPLRTVTASGGDGRSYRLEIWAEVRDDTCAGHAYGVPMIKFLAEHPCRGLTRDLITTKVDGKAVGVATSSTSFPGTPDDPYSVTSKFRDLVTKNGTGNLADLFREGYRLPHGPDQVPSPDAFNTVGQDSGVTVYDMWYLNGPTPENDKPLITLSEDIFLQF
jgi:hypothetical protein